MIDIFFTANAIVYVCYLTISVENIPKSLSIYLVQFVARLPPVNIAFDMLFNKLTRI